jgi:hypothetical protein
VQVALGEHDEILEEGSRIVRRVVAAATVELATGTGALGKYLRLAGVRRLAAPD